MLLVEPARIDLFVDVFLPPVVVVVAALLEVVFDDLVLRSVRYRAPVLLLPLVLVVDPAELPLVLFDPVTVRL